MGRSVLVAVLESYLDIVMYSSVLRSLVWLQALVFHCVTFFYEIQRLATAVESSSRLGRSTARVMTSSLSTPLVGLSVCLSACLSVCLSGCLFVWLSFFFFKGQRRSLPPAHRACEKVRPLTVFTISQSTQVGEEREREKRGERKGLTRSWARFCDFSSFTSYFLPTR